MDKIPKNYEAEQAVLASLLRLPDQFPHLKDIITSNCFHYKPLEWAWKACEQLHEQGFKIDTVTLADQLERDGKLATFTLPNSKLFTGRAAISGIRDIPTSESAKTYAMIVQDFNAKRTILTWLTNAASGCMNGRTSQDIISDLEKSLSTIKLNSGKIRNHTTNMETAGMQSLYAAELASRGERACETGFIDLDRLIFPQKTELIIVAGRPGQGKSSLLKDIAIAAAKTGKHIKFFTLETGHIQLAQRIQSKLSGIPAYRIMQGKLSEDEWSKLRGETAEILSELPIEIVDLPAISIGQIRTESRRDPVDVIFVDYIQLARSDSKNDRRDLDIGEITGGLKALAMELDIPIFAAAQLNRGVEGRADKRPTLNDLRESGSIENDANTVLMLYPKSDFTSPGYRAIEVIIGKHRDGPTGSVDLIFKEDTVEFQNAETRTIFTGG